MAGGWTPPGAASPGGPGGFAVPPPPQQASGRAVAALVLGIVALVLCGFVAGIPAAILGKMELNAIARGEAPAAGKGLAAAGFWMGLIDSILCCLGTIFYVIAVLAAGAQSGYSGY